MDIQKMAAEIGIIAVGMFLIVDSFFIHSLVFDYSKFGLQALDPLINHWMLGGLLLVFAYIDITAD